jgi:hypothetical protein
MNLAEEFRNHADDCRRMARSTRDPNSKAQSVDHVRAARGGCRDPNNGPSMTEDTDVGDFLASRLRAIEQKADSFAHMDKVSLVLPMVADAVEKMRAAGLTNEEIAGLFHHAAGELGAA